VEFLGTFVKSRKTPDTIGSVLTFGSFLSLMHMSFGPFCLNEDLSAPQYYVIYTVDVFLSKFYTLEKLQYFDLLPPPQVLVNGH